MSFAAAVLQTARDDFRINEQWKPSKPGLHAYFEHLREHAVRLRFHRNDIIFQEHATAAHVYRLTTGCVRLCSHGQTGPRHINDFLFADDIFGLGEFGQFPITAEAVGPVILLAYPKTLFEELGDVNPGFQNSLLSHYRSLLGRAQNRLFVTTCLSARERVASFLLQMYGTRQVVLGDRVDLPMARQEIADYLGLTVETICRALAALKDAGLIAVPNAHQIAVVDPAGLRALTEGKRIL